MLLSFRSKASESIFPKKLIRSTFRSRVCESQAHLTQDEITNGIAAASNFACIACDRSVKAYEEAKLALNVSSNEVYEMGVMIAALYRSAVAASNAEEFLFNIQSSAKSS
jgi:hypothetical protein